jgi:hypothetical protein
MKYGFGYRKKWNDLHLGACRKAAPRYPIYGFKSRISGSDLGKAIYRKSELI